KLLHRALETEEQQADITGPGMAIVTPIFDPRGRLLGVLAQRFSKVAAGSSLPPIYYVLMVLDGIVLLAFVFIMISRTVEGPLGELEGAAAAVARGELDHRLEVKGPRELASLSQSFNVMTEALSEQLRHLESQRQSLIRSEKLASVGRLAAGVAHEIGNPLQSVIGFTDILLDRPPQPERQADLLRRIQTEAQRIHQIVRQLLDYSRSRETEAQAVDVAAIVEEALALLRPQRRFKAVTVTVDPSLASLPAVAVNAQQFVQVLVNLFLNAADVLEAEGQVLLVGEEVGSRVLLAVENDGPRISEADRGRIFDPFFTTKDPGEGTGLGLAVSLSIVESFGGSLQLAEGEQTRFEVSLPRWREDEGDAG
ncbi:MAG: HAMP domain-containing histidine kinase, partial [Deltaproteobacteria bacterium]|nr:HAMP domain-containing histidine kinase [Deltaproteobacteria bacterium]